MAIAGAGGVAADAIRAETREAIARTIACFTQVVIGPADSVAIAVGTRDAIVIGGACRETGGRAADIHSAGCACAGRAGALGVAQIGGTSGIRDRIARCGGTARGADLGWIRRGAAFEIRAGRDVTNWRMFAVSGRQTSAAPATRKIGGRAMTVAAIAMGYADGAIGPAARSRVGGVAGKTGERARGDGSD